MTKMNLGNSQQQANSCYEYCQNLTSQLSDLTTVTSVIDSSPFEGTAARQVKNFVSSVYVPFLKAAILLTSAIGTDVKKLPTKYESAVANKSYSSEELQRKIDELTARIHAEQSMLDTLAKHHDTDHSHFVSDTKHDVQARKAAYESQLEKYKRLLRKFEAFDRSSPQLFSDIASLKSAVQQGAQQVKQCRVSGFAVPADLGWASLVNTEWDKFVHSKATKYPSFYQAFVNNLTNKSNILSRNERSFNAFLKEYGLHLQRKAVLAKHITAYGPTETNNFVLTEDTRTGRKIFEKGTKFIKVGEVLGHALNIGNFTWNVFTDGKEAACQGKKGLYDLNKYVTLGAISDGLTAGISSLMVGLIAIADTPEIMAVGAGVVVAAIGMGLPLLVTSAYDSNTFNIQTNMNHTMDAYQKSCTEVAETKADMVNAEDCKLWHSKDKK